MPTATIMPITSSAPAAVADTGPAPVNPSALLDRDAFLKLLVAQLRYQDPTKPVDSSAMVAQSAQLSMVDQLATISKSLERQGTTDKLTLAGSMVGKQITFANPDGMVTTGVVAWVRFDGDEVLLGTGAWEVPYDGITSISAAPVAPPLVAADALSHQPRSRPSRSHPHRRHPCRQRDVRPPARPRRTALHTPRRTPHQPTPHPLQPSSHLSNRSIQMIRAMSSALSGLRNHQTMLDVVGNDIANVSTVGFKTSTTVFSDVLTQTLQGAAAPTTTAGGTNPAQIGLGSRLVGTVQSFAQGAIQRTGRPTDLAVQGDGFFVVQGNGQQLYTRAGSFTLDAAGNLTTQEGMLVQGWQADAAGGIDTNQALGGVQIRVGELQPPNQTELAELGGNLRPTRPSATRSRSR